MSDDHNCFHIITSPAFAVDQRKTCLSSLHHFWKTCFRWQKSTSLSWFLATHLQPGKEHCCLLRCPTPSLDLDQPEYQPWCEAKWSMCIMPLLWANNWNPRETRGPWGELAEGRKATMRSFLSSKANVSWHAAIFKMLRGDMRGKLAPISSYPALIRCRSVACFRHPNFSIHYIPSGIPVLCWTYVNEVSPKLQKSIIYQLCMAWCPTSKTDLTLECQTLQSASWRNSNGNRFVCWAFCAPWTWKQTECSPLTFLGQHIMLLAKLAPISSYPALIRGGLVACRKGSWRMHFVHHCFRIAPTFQYITYLQASLYCAELMSKYTPRVFKNIQPICSFTCLPQHRLDFPITDVALEFFWWVMITIAFILLTSLLLIKEKHVFPLCIISERHVLGGKSQRHWADSLPLICNPEKNIAVCFAVQHLALIWTNQNTNHGAKQNDQCALCPCYELTIGIQGKPVGPGANLQKAGKRPCEAFYHPKQMSHGMLQSSKCCVGTCVGSLLPSQATRHWFVAAQWHASNTPTLQCITYLQASLYCAELMSMRFHRNCKSHSFINCVRLGVQHLKLIWHWNAKHGKPAWWKNSNGNRFVCWAFCAPWTWKQTECSPLTFLGQHIMLLAKLAPISSYPALIRGGLVACRKGSWRMHFLHHCFRIAPTFQYITYLQASLYCAELMSKYTPRVFKNIQPICSFTCLPQHRLDFPITDVALEFFWWAMITIVFIS